MNYDSHKILLVDDNNLYLEGLNLALNHLYKNIIIQSVYDGEHLTQDLINDFEPDIIILDISMRTMGGLDALKNLRTFDTETPVLMLSMHDRKEYVEESLRLKANGFLLKDTGVDQIKVVINQLLLGENYFPETKPL